jgi:rhamnosyl/mannosyltransferase
MRVLQFFKTYYPATYGGTEQFMFQLCEALSEIGIESEVLSLSQDGQPGVRQIGGHRAYYARVDFEVASTGVSLSVLGKFRALAAQADIIHYHYPWPYMDLVHFAARVKRPSVLTFHTDIIRQRWLRLIYRPLERFFFDSVDMIVATSPNYAASSPALRRYRDKTQVIPIGIDRSRYPEISEECRAYWHGRFGRRFFLFVGMLRYYKGLHFLLDAMAAAQYPLLIVGAGPIERELRAHAAHLRLSNVHFLGALPEADKVALLELCTAVVFPSHLRAEAFGIFLLEGAMFAKPLISCEIGTGTSYINVNGETGLVVPPGDPAALRQAIDFIWTHPEAAAELGRKARLRYETLFTAKAMAAEYARLYRALIAKQVDDRHDRDPRR